MIQELQTFRQQYPQYNDLDDWNLVNLLAKKYPEYSDLVGKVKQEKITEIAGQPEFIASHIPFTPSPKETLTQKLQRLGQGAYQKISEYAEKETGPGETIRSIGTVYGPVEAAANLVSQLWGVPATGIAEIIKAVGGPEWLPEKVGEATIYQPRTEAGKQFTQAASYPWAKINEIANAVADAVMQQKVSGKPSPKEFPWMAEAMPFGEKEETEQEKALRATVAGTVVEALGIALTGKGISKILPAGAPKGKTELTWPEGEPFIERAIPIAPELEKPALPPGQGFLLKETPKKAVIRPAKEPEIFVKKPEGGYTPGFWSEELGRYVTPLEEVVPEAKGLPAGQGFVTKPTPPKTILRPEEYKPKGKGPVEISPEGEPIYPPGMKPVTKELAPEKFNPNKPPVIPEDQKVLQALKLKNGDIYFDRESATHVQVLEKLGLPAEQIGQSGYITKEGKFAPMSGEVTIPKAEMVEVPKVEPTKPAEPPYIPEGVKPPEIKPATFRQFVESKGYGWPIKATKPEYQGLKAEFDALKGEKPKAEIPKEKTTELTGADKAYFDLGKKDAEVGQKYTPPIVGEEAYRKGFESVKPKEVPKEEIPSEPIIKGKPTVEVTEPEYSVVARREPQIDLKEIKNLEDIKKYFESGQLDYGAGKYGRRVKWEDMKSDDLTKYNQFWEEAAKGYKISKGKETVTVSYGREWDPEVQEWKTGFQTFKLAIPEERQGISGEGIEFLGWTEMYGGGKEGIKKFREIAKVDPQFAENPTFRLERMPENPEAFRFVFTAKDSKTGMPRRYRFGPEMISRTINDLIESKTLKEGDYVRLSPGYLEGKSSEIYLSKKGMESLIDKYYEEGTKKEKVFKKKGAIALPRISIEFPEVKETIEKFKNLPKGIKEKINQFRFYIDTPLEFRNAIRNEVVGAIDKAREIVYTKIATGIWGGMKTEDVKKSVEVIFARDQLSRARAGKGNPNISIDEAEKILADVEKGAPKEAIDAVEKYRNITEAYQKDLVERGVLEPEQLIEEYAPHYVVDYTPDWTFNVGIPARLKRPFRGYKKPALGSSKEYKQDVDALLGHFLKIQHDNLIEDFIQKQAAKYDILPTLSEAKRIELWGAEKSGKPRVPKPGTIREIEGKRYRVYTPDIPYSRQLFPTEEGLMALGRYKRTYVLPENIYNAFSHFSDRGNAITYWTNRATAYWKSAAILSHFPSFNVNNIIGDTWMATVQHPHPKSLFLEFPTAMKYLVGKSKEGYFKELDSFIKNQNILQGLFTTAELARIRKAHDPVRFLLQWSNNASRFRESITRAAYASSLLKEMKAGRGKELVKAHSWIKTEGLPLEDALGKISRDVLVDYQWVNRSFHRYIRGMVFPFGTWYFKSSPLLWRWTQKNWGKALMGFMALPLASLAFNNRNEKVKEMESRLPDYVRNKVHFVMGENQDKTIRTWSFQLPQDVLIGTKIFSIATDYANKAANREISIKEAALRTLRDWGIQEKKGFFFLTGPMIRFVTGLVHQRDPYDNSPIYSMKPENMTWQRRLKDQALFFIKSSVPFLSISIGNYERGLPKDIAFKKLMDNFAGLGALGIHDLTPTGQVKIGGKLYDFDDLKKINWIQNKELGYLGDLEDDFVANSKNPIEFINSLEAKKSILKIYNLWSDFVPEMKKETDENARVQTVVDLLGKRLTNRLTDLSVLQKWQRVRFERAKTDEERKKLGLELQQLRKRSIAEGFKKKPKTAREIEILQRMKDSELPWQYYLDLEAP